MEEMLLHRGFAMIDIYFKATAKKTLKVVNQKWNCQKLG
jgi:hypothetical protein